MQPQLQALKAMLAANTAWQAEVASSNRTGSASATDRIHLYCAFESLHPYPRIEFQPSGWDYDFHNGNCQTRFRAAGTIDLIRQLPNTDDPNATEEQFDEVCQVLTAIMTELSEASYQGGAQLAFLTTSILDGPHYDSLEERETEEGGIRYVCWWANFLVETK